MSFFIDIITVSNLPFSVLVIAAARGMQKILEGELLFEPFSLQSICRQQIDARLFSGKEDNLGMTIIVEDNPYVVFAISSSSV